ncbi:MAG TPA: pantoate--beta-alanine ligase [Thermodesulfobacteriota bacterium]|nr:pantoate--beta-alanine ligase [Deltaproteobacteria bacterium]HNR13592.1 pantoate--beta-alanine ligase [Thermodesulfobacteriota bacterium]HNU72062.1 pantoate--beta-alanine ligase [Thermodesulfobacteriota bacterium]HQO78353.1 pantoate--beta-alanine ligase [Thermodesulfobacteriota bacterium]
MDIVRSVQEMHSRARQARTSNKTIAFVPTMGFLHDGHVFLMHEGRKRGDLLVISIFVNPTQFGVGEDYEQYPRDLEGDAQKAAGAGVDIIFAPSAGDMYPSGYQTFVAVESVTRNLCGMSRPTHFQGVTTVVAKLFNIVQPHIAIFGQKDFQQLVTIRQMARDLNFNIDVIGCPTVRENDGVAMSSRNKYLNPNERVAARCLSHALAHVEGLVRSGETNSQKLIQEAVTLINAEPLATIDYVKICDPLTIQDSATIEDTAVMALAVRIGTTRLIDNRILTRSL